MRQVIQTCNSLIGLPLSNFIRLNIFMKQQIEPRSFSITESYSPRYRKGELKHLDNFIKDSPPLLCNHSGDSVIDPLLPSILNTLNSCIANLEELFKRRMLVHEEEIIQIAHSEIKKMKEESEKMVRKYSQLIEEKNLSHELLDLKYEVLYFQKRACDLFDENKALKSKINRLKEQLVILKIGEESDQIALKNISKKYLKEKTLKLKLLSNNVKTDLSAVEKSNQKLLSLSKLYNPEDILLSHKHEKGKSQPVYFRRNQSTDRPKDIKIKLNSLKPKPYLSTQPKPYTSTQP